MPCITQRHFDEAESKYSTYEREVFARTGAISSPSAKSCISTAPGRSRLASTRTMKFLLGVTWGALVCEMVLSGRDNEVDSYSFFVNRLRAFGERVCFLVPLVQFVLL